MTKININSVDKAHEVSLAITSDFQAHKEFITPTLIRSEVPEGLHDLVSMAIMVAGGDQQVEHPVTIFTRNLLNLLPHEQMTHPKAIVNFISAVRKNDGNARARVFLRLVAYEYEAVTPRTFEEQAMLNAINETEEFANVVFSNYIRNEFTQSFEYSRALRAFFCGMVTWLGMNHYELRSTCGGRYIASPGPAADGLFSAAFVNISAPYKTIVLEWDHRVCLADMAFKLMKD